MHYRKLAPELSATASATAAGAVSAVEGTATAEVAAAGTVSPAEAATTEVTATAKAWCRHLR